MSKIFIEAESFSKKGGWIVETQSMETLHSAYLMAHGMGRSVADAETEFEVLKSGEYRVFAFTRDWTAVWNVENPAGLFEIKIDDKPLENVLGNESEGWAWQKAGAVYLEKGTHKIALHDLTGFNGRCDAIFMSCEDIVPESDTASMDKMRKEFGYKEIAKDETEYDLIVVGGGIAGICTAISASRSGAKVLLLQDRPVLGGCNSSEIRVCLGGRVKDAPYENLGDVVREVAPVMGDSGLFDKEYYEDGRKKFAFMKTDAKVLTNECVTDAVCENGGILAVISTNTESGKKTEYRAKMFCDCSGDAVLARLSGAEVMYGNESESEFGESLAPDEHKKLVMGHSIRWYSKEQEQESGFPDIDWGLSFNDESYSNCTAGDWEQETGFRRDMVTEIEYIRDYGLRAIYSNWAYQKNHAKNKKDFAKYELEWVSPIGGKRESYRVKGDYILTQHDIDAKTEYNDGTANITWGIDIHFPHPINEEQFGEAFRSCAFHRGMPRMCQVPYRCLYSKDVKNLFLGGRAVSASHVAFSAIRVMRTLGMLGEVVGLAAGICKKYNCLPREVYEKHLDELKELMKKGVEIEDSFAWTEIGEKEKYHFKELGFWHIDTGESEDWVGEAELERFKYCVKKLGLRHMHEMPKKWKS